MGEVWLAVASGPGNFEKRVVIKTVLPELAEKPGYVSMLVNEASLAARLDHPNIVQVFDLGCIDDIYYIAMEYLPGRTLAQILKRTAPRVPEWVALTVLAACCDGIHYAHELRDDAGKPLGLLHRDISPGNIMATFTGRIAVLDFGIAVANRGEHTNSGTLKGKYHYMAPERISGEPADRKSDVYSLGVILYLLLTGTRPFAADGEYELLRSIIHDRPASVRIRAPWVSPNLEAIVNRAMARNPGERYADAALLAADLRAHLRTRGEAREPRDLGQYLGGVFPDATDAPACLKAAPSIPSGNIGIRSLLAPTLGSATGIGDAALPSARAISGEIAVGDPVEGEDFEISLATGDVESVETRPQEQHEIAAGSDGMPALPAGSVATAPREGSTGPDSSDPGSEPSTGEPSSELTSIYDTARPARRTPSFGIDVFAATKSADDRERVADIFGQGISPDRDANPVSHPFGVRRDES